MNTLPHHILTMLFGFAAPLTSGVICLIVIAAFLSQSKDWQTKQIAGVLLWELVACVFCWFSLICFIVIPRLYTQLEFLFVLGILYAQVLTYRFIFLHTRIVASERFSRCHYVLPFIPSAAVLICTLLFDFDQRMVIRLAHPPINVYTIVIKLIPILFFGYNLYYSFRSLGKIKRYSSVIKNYSANEGRYSTGWLRMLVCIALSSLPLALIPAVMGPGFFFGSLLTVLGMSVIVFKDVILTYYTITKNYTLIYSGNNTIKTSVTNAENQAEENTKINKELFEYYINFEKPYLNPELHITDLVSALNTNRTYLSSFINKEYSMNFSRFINLKRLEELHKISKLPQFAGMSRLDLVIHVGFCNYRGYLRFKKEEDKCSQITINRR